MQSGYFVRNDLGRITKLAAVAVPGLLSAEVVVMIGISALAVAGVAAITNWLSSEPPAVPATISLDKALRQARLARRRFSRILDGR